MKSGELGGKVSESAFVVETSVQDLVNLSSGLGLTVSIVSRVLRDICLGSDFVFIEEDLDERLGDLADRSSPLLRRSFILESISIKCQV